MQAPNIASQKLITSLIRDVADFPKPGVVFKDITPLLASPEGFAAAISELVLSVGEEHIDVVVGMEARGFIFAAPVALALGAGFVPVRKPGKLPSSTIEQSYQLEYGSETLSIHADAIWPGARVLLVDDVLATGGTIVASAELVKRLGGEIAGVRVLMELSFLNGAQVLKSAGLPEARAIVTV